jgi:iron complex transport system substrate-binding protein
LFGVFVALAGAVCAARGDIPAARLVVDMAGRTVTVPARIERTAAVRPGALRLLVYVDGAQRVAAVESMEKRRASKPYLMAFPELAGRPSLGPPHGGDPELIAGLGLDVLFSTRLRPAEADRWQQRTGVPVVVLEYGNLGPRREALDKSLRLIGEVLDRSERAEDLIGFFDDIEQDLERRMRGALPSPAPSVYVAGVAYRGAHGVVSTEPRYEPFSMTGARNVAGAIGEDHAFVDREMIVVWDPEYVFVDQASTPHVLRDLRRPEMRGLRAVREGRIYGLLPYNWYWTNFGTVLANAYAVSHALAPERFANASPAEQARRIYAFLLGRDVYDRMRDTYGGYGAIDVR